MNDGLSRGQGAVAAGGRVTLPYAIGAEHCPGLSKLIEEAGEVQCVAGKVIGLGHLGDHWDGTNLRERLEEELGDLQAAIAFVVEMNGLRKHRVGRQRMRKLRQFRKWHEGAR